MPLALVLELPLTGMIERAARAKPASDTHERRCTDKAIAAWPGCWPAHLPLSPHRPMRQLLEPGVSAEHRAPRVLPEAQSVLPRT